MSLTEALEQAPEDVLGQRWARSARGEQTYVAVQQPGGRVVVETRWREGYRRGVRLRRAPRGLRWEPV